MTKIFVSGNYLKVVTAGGSKMSGPKADVKFTREGDNFIIHGLTGYDPQRFIFENVVDEAGDAYASEDAFEEFLDTNTGNFNSGGATPQVITVCVAQDDVDSLFDISDSGITWTAVEDTDGTFTGTRPSGFSGAWISPQHNAVFVDSIGAEFFIAATQLGNSIILSTRKGGVPTNFCIEAPTIIQFIQISQ